MRLLPLKNLVPMLVAGLVFQGCASGRFAFAGAAWMCLVSLATLARCASLPLFLSTSFAVIWLGRLIGWHGVLLEDGAIAAGSAVVAASATAAVLTVLCLLCHRIAMRELPTLGPQVLPAAVVVVEWLARTFDLPGASLLPLFTSQPGDVPWFRWVDLITPLGISFGVAWAQGVLAGFGEAWLAEDPHPQHKRERGQRIAANLMFWSVFIVGHCFGFLRDAAHAQVRPADVTGRGGNDVAFGLCAAYLVACLVAAVVVRARRAAPPATPSSTPPASPPTTLSTTPPNDVGAPPVEQPA